MKKLFLTVAMFALVANLNANNFEQQFIWIKQTFLENDAGVPHIVERRGVQALEAHNQVTLERVRAAETAEEFFQIANEWLRFFRGGHHWVGPNPTLETPPAQQPAAQTETPPVTHPTPAFWDGDMAQFKAYLTTLDEPTFEGIWNIGGNCKIAIIREDESYVGVIIESPFDGWLPGMIKLRIEKHEDGFVPTFYARNFAPLIGEEPDMMGNNLIWIDGNRWFVNIHRQYPVFPSDPYVDNFLRIRAAREPFIERLNENTMYFRLASFNIFHRANLDSIIDANRAKITSTENLIIDLRDNGGGDPAFPLLEYLYTNPIRIFGTELLASEGNIRVLYELSQGINPMWAVMGQPSEELVNAVKHFGATLYEQVRDRVGEFVSITHEVDIEGEEDIGERIITFDKVHPYPRNVGIIVNGWTGSAAELYVLAARQSRKVKIFGESNTRGMVDTSSIGGGIVESPCGEIWLQYTGFRAAWVPAMVFDDVGIQPDFLIDHSVPSHRWVQYVSDMMSRW